MHGVGHYEAEILSLPSNAILKEDIKQDLVALYQDKIYEGFAWMHGWKSFGVSAYRNLVEQVRNRLLTFCVEIQSAMEKGDTEDVGSQLSQLQVTNIFYTTVYGQSSNIAVGGTNVSQSLTSVLVGDIESLAEYLRKHQVDESDIADLRGAIEDDPAPTDHGKLGPRVSDWIGSMVTKAAIGTWGIGANAAGGLLADATKHYYGLIA